MDFEEFHVRDVMKLLREIILPRLCDLEAGSSTFAQDHLARMSSHA